MRRAGCGARRSAPRPADAVINAAYPFGEPRRGRVDRLAVEGTDDATGLGGVARRARLRPRVARHRTRRSGGAPMMRKGTRIFVCNEPQQTRSRRRSPGQPRRARLRPGPERGPTRWPRAMPAAESRCQVARGSHGEPSTPPCALRRPRARAARRRRAERVRSACRVRHTPWGCRPRRACDPRVWRP